jgi:putative ABC transport system substrate-binding protein
MTQSGHDAPYCELPICYAFRAELGRCCAGGSYVRRRDFIRIVAGSAVGWPMAVQAQQPDRMRRVSVLLGIPENDPETKSRIRAFRLGMRDAGWVEGRNIQIELRYATDRDAINRHVAGLIRAVPDVILANSTPVMAAVRPSINAIPVVFVVVNYPVGQGFVPNLTKPGGNVTGFSFIEPEIVGKWINLLSDVKPDLSRLALIFNPDSAGYYDTYLHSFKASPQRTGVEVHAAHVRSEAEVERAIAELARDQRAGLIVAADPFTVGMRAVILKVAEQHRVPLICPYRQFVLGGGLMSYGPDTIDIFRRSSSYVDRILKGERVGNLPVQSPDKFELAVNLKTARALGLSVRESFLLLADEVIE